MFFVENKLLSIIELDEALNISNYESTDISFKG